MPSILWRRLDREGHEFCWLDPFRLFGVALIVHEGVPCALDYMVVWDETWRTRSASMHGNVGESVYDIEIAATADGAWEMDGNDVEAVAGCIDVDLNFSPSTNTLPIRRSQLEVGQEAEVRSAWLRFPSFELEPLVQRYRRIEERTYEYESGSFSAELHVNDAGLVTSYEAFCEAVAQSD